MTTLESLGVLLLVAAISAWINHRYVRLPSAIGVMVVSLIFSMLLIFLGWWGVLEVSLVSSFVSNFDFEKLLLHGMLAFLLFAGGLSVDISQLRSQQGVVAVLSTLGVLASTVITGGLFWLTLGWVGIEIPFIFALLFGAIVSPTDAVAVLGILKKVGVPKSLETTVVGESLFNDGVGVVVFFAVSSLAYGQDLSAGSAVMSLAVEVAGGAALGLVTGLIIFKMLMAVDDYVVEILLTLALATGSYAAAEKLHLSAPICVVVAGLIIGNQGRMFAMSEHTREHLDTFWELIDEMLNAVLFVLVGVEILVLSVSWNLVLASIFGILAVQIGRFISVWLPITLMKRWRSFSPHVVKILSWGGLRGGISIALALSLPLGGFHDLLVVCTYGVVLFSVLIQGSTLPLMLKHLDKNTAPKLAS